MTRVLRWLKLGEPIPDGSKLIKWGQREAAPTSDSERYAGITRPMQLEEQYLYEVPIMEDGSNGTQDRQSNNKAETTQKRREEDAPNASEFDPTGYRSYLATRTMSRDVEAVGDSPDASLPQGKQDESRAPSRHLDTDDEG